MRRRDRDRAIFQIRERVESLEEYIWKSVYIYMNLLLSFRQVSMRNGNVTATDRDGAKRCFPI